ncbi:Asp23/Gls24 family envelope stress response protein [Williamsia sp. CHRR-6]|uniref:Asp23/Gls24 family envelope stress response protein n=1 Tax=Williamsia sp. CHRR-6 TaxID=2835871 RepID=UPI001BD98D10|nr:Asp23/Gls24 family envelope stress response protein [Williamsia sp. CHRR-6]MBT0567306.1 Asp23/Gls24 family envelope stress response protein [Williamsia sp. CHRR-6]
MTSATAPVKSTSGKEIKDDHRDLVGAFGRTTIADTVVSKIAGIAAREIDGVYDLGGQAARAFGKVREVIPGAGADVTQGVRVEVGEKQAAVDIGLVAEYGVPVHDLAAAVRSNVISSIEGMTSLEVTEVNVSVYDVHFEGEKEENEEGPRVQ